MSTIGSEDVLAAIKAQPKGATRAQILANLGNPFSKRNLSRYLGPLEDINRVRTERAGKEVLYFVREHGAARSEKAGEHPPAPIDAPEAAAAEGANDGGSAAPAGTNGADDGGQLPQTRDQKPDISPAARMKSAAERAEPGAAEAGDGPPEEPDAKPAAAGAAADAGLDPDFPAMAELVALDVVLGGVPKQGAVLLLKKAALEAHKEGDAVMAFVRYALGRIDRFTAAEVQDWGVPAEQFAEWQRHWAGDYDSPASADFNSPAETPGPDNREDGTVRAAGQHAKTKPERERSLSGKAAAQPTDNAKPAASQRKEKGAVEARPNGGFARQREDPPLSRAEPALPELPMTESALRNSAANGLAGAFIDWIGRRMPGGLTRNQRIALVSALGALALLVYQALSRYPWLALGVPIAAAVGLLVFGGSRAAPGNFKSQISDCRSDTAGGRRRSRWRYVVFTAAGLSVISAAGWLWLRKQPPAPPRPPEDAVREHLARNAGPLPVRLADLHVGYGNATTGNCRLTYEARFETTAPLFRLVDPADYLRTHFAAEMATINAAAALLRADPALADSDLKSQVSNFKSGAFAPVLVTTATPPGASATAAGTLVAWKHDTTWIFTGDPVRLDRAALAGDPKPAGALAVDLPEDAARLQTLIAGQVAYAAEVQAAARELAAQRGREVEQRKAAFSALLRVGTLFTGVVNDPTKHQPQRFVLEITAATPPRLTASIRNEGGWAETRTLQGEWSVDAEGQLATVTLRTTASAAVAGAGPLLQDRMDWALAFALRADGSAAAAAPPLASSLSPLTSAAAPAAVARVDPAAVADLKAAWTRGLAAVLSATRPGAAYRGIALSKIYRTEEALVLRFGPDVGRDRRIPPSDASADSRRGSATPPYINPSDAVILDATLAPAGGGAARAFRGTVIANTYRAGGSPIRLQSADGDRVASTNSKSVLGIVTGAGLSLALRLDADRLVGEDGWFTYTFAPDPGANEGGGTREQGGNSDDRESGKVENAGENAEGATNAAAISWGRDALIPVPVLFIISPGGACERSTARL